MHEAKARLITFNVYSNSEKNFVHSNIMVHNPIYDAGPLYDSVRPPQAENLHSHTQHTKCMKMVGQENNREEQKKLHLTLIADGSRLQDSVCCDEAESYEPPS